MRMKLDTGWEMSSEWELKDDFVKSIYNVICSWKGDRKSSAIPGRKHPPITLCPCTPLRYRDSQAGSTCEHLLPIQPQPGRVLLSPSTSSCSPQKNQCAHHPEVSRGHSPGSSECHSPPCVDEWNTVRGGVLFFLSQHRELIAESSYF